MKVYLVGIKGVAMTALAEVLLDAGHQVSGSDVAADFVTARQLTAHKLVIDSFDTSLPADTDLVVYTAAHSASEHPQVQAARVAGIPVKTHAEALADWFNQKHGIAVCGVGGKSTISAMISWILEKAGWQPSFAVGVGDIIGLDKTGAWTKGDYFVAEADEYCTDPKALERGEPLIPRFHYLQPQLTIASSIVLDHPDVYRDEAHTRQVFTEWFSHLTDSAVLLSSDQNRNWLELTPLTARRCWYGDSPESDYRLVNEPVVVQQRLEFMIGIQGKTRPVSLAIPGHYNALNALAAIGATSELGLDPTEAAKHLSGFQSTMRRFERVGTWQGVESYDDYAHHPRELTAVLAAARQWFAGRRLVVAFQPHTYSRTKHLFDEFVIALSSAPELALVDIFASARESYDATVSSSQLATAVERNGHNPIPVFPSIAELADWCKTELQPNDVLLTLGAGDIYQVHALLGASHE